MPSDLFDSALAVRPIRRPDIHLPSSRRSLVTGGLDAMRNGFLLDVQTDVVNTFHVSLLVGPTWGD